MRYKLSDPGTVFAVSPSPLIPELIDFVHTGRVRGVAVEAPEAIAFHRELKGYLQTIARGTPLSRTAVERLLDEARQVQITPQALKPDGISLLYRVHFDNWIMTFSFDTLQLNIQRQFFPLTYPGDLRQCQQCAKFFFVSQRRAVPSTRGRPPSKYCSDECEAAKRSKSSTPRVQRWRERKAAETARKHR